MFRKRTPKPEATFRSWLNVQIENAHRMAEPRIDIMPLVKDDLMHEFDFTVKISDSFSGFQTPHNLIGDIQGIPVYLRADA